MGGGSFFIFKYLAIFQNRGTSIIYVQGAEIFRGPLFYRRPGGRFCGLWPGPGEGFFRIAHDKDFTLKGSEHQRGAWQRFYPKGLRTPEREGATFNFRCQSGEIYGPPDINCGRSLCTCFSYIQVKSS